MGCDYWKVLTVKIEYIENYKLIIVEKEFSIEPCIFYNLEVKYSNDLENDDAIVEQRHRARVLECLRLTPIPEPIILFSYGMWNTDYLKYKQRTEELVGDIPYLRRITLMKKFQIC